MIGAGLVPVRRAHEPADQQGQQHYGDESADQRPEHAGKLQDRAGGRSVM